MLEQDEENQRNCPICLQDLEIGGDIPFPKFTYECRTCVTVSHVFCVAQWINTGARSCVYCRQPIQSDLWNDGLRIIEDELAVEYLNLLNATEIERETYVENSARFWNVVRRM